MKKYLATILSAVAVSALADPITIVTPTSGALGDIENTANVVTAVSAKTIQAGGDISVTESEGVITVSYTTPAAFDPSTINAHLAALDTATNNLASTKVDKEEGKGLVTLTEYATVKSTAESAVQTVAKAANGATELTVTQNGTAVTIDVDLSAYAKAADAYVHPSYDAASAAFVKVGRDATGHVVIGDSIAASDITALVPEADDYNATEAAKVADAGTKIAAIGAVSTADLSTLNECIAAIQAIVAAAAGE